MTLKFIITIVYNILFIWTRSLTLSTEEIVLFINGPAGKLEALYCEQEQAKGIVLLCHPHPLYAGTMQNKVITTLQRIARDNNYTTLRFNFRGVGKSEGSYGEWQGEIADAMAVYQYIQQKHPELPVTVMGFSFGACIASCLAHQLEQQGGILKQLIMIAPPIEMFNLDGRVPSQSPLLIIQPDADEVINPQQVYQWEQSLTREHTLLSVPECSHFFHGKLTDLKELITPYI